MLLAVAVAIVPRRPDVIGLAALAAAVVIALQLGITPTRFYLYIPWFFGPAIVARLAGAYGAPAGWRRRPTMVRGQ